MCNQLILPHHVIVFIIQTEKVLISVFLVMKPGLKRVVGHIDIHKVEISRWFEWEVGLNYKALKSHISTERLGFSIITHSWANFLVIARLGESFSAYTSSRSIMWCLSDIRCLRSLFGCLLVGCFALITNEICMKKLGLPWMEVIGTLIHYLNSIPM